MRMTCGRRRPISATSAPPILPGTADVEADILTSVPVFAKLSPDVTDITLIARACADAGADGFSLINTLLGMVIDTDTMAPALGGVTGGLSGPAIRRIEESALQEVVVTNSIPLSEAGSKCGRIKQLSIANLMADAIRSIHEETSVSVLFI